MKNKEAIYANAERMYDFVQFIYKKLMRNAEAFHRPEFVIKVFDKADAIIQEVNDYGN